MLDINLLDWRSIEYTKRKQRFLFVVTFVAAIALILLFFVYLTLVGILHNIQSDNVYLKSKIDSLTPKVLLVKNLTTEAQVVRQSIGLVNKLEKNRDVPIKVLEFLATIPTSVYLTSILYNGNTLIIEGMGGQDILNQIIQKMIQNVTLFNNVTLIGPKADPGLESVPQSFKITAMVQMNP